MYTCIMRGSEQVTIQDSQDNLDLASYVRGGQLNLVLEIDTGVVITSTLGNRDAIFSSVPIRGEISYLKVICKGRVQGSNGYGGYGIGDPATNDGGLGGHAITIPAHIVVDCSIGTLESGGGGGGLGVDLPFGTSGGGGFLGGTIGVGGEVGETAQYGFASGGAYDSGAQGGDCNGAGLDGDPGIGTIGTGIGGLSGFGVDSQGFGVTVLSGSANILGGVDS